MLYYVLAQYLDNPIILDRFSLVLQSSPYFFLGGS